MKDKKEIHTLSVEVGGKNLQFEVGRLAEQATAAVLGRYGDTMILATVVSGQEREDLGYFPLFVEYQEKLYAGGRIKGSRWVKREGRPSDEAILNARLVDRSIRPLFPKAFKNETQIILTVLSVDAENDPDILAINTASAALAISNIPWKGPIGAVRLGYDSKEKNNLQPHRSTKDGNFFVNPTYSEREYSDLDLVVSETNEAVFMVEAAANEISEQTFMGALKVAQSETAKIIATIEKLTKEVGKKKQEAKPSTPDPNVVKTVKKHAKEILKDLEKPIPGKRTIGIDGIADAIAEEEPDLKKVVIKEVLSELIREKIGTSILKTGKRPDGRTADEIRPISIEVDILPRTHGSAIFKRGLTQALTITTLATPSLEQWIESMEGEGTKRYMHHYYMPPYSVGEVGRLGWPSRREIGHGALAERALEPMIPSDEEFPYTIRVVSELLSSNGSTSMAAVCGSTLSLMDAGVPLKKPVAGIAMGLIMEKTQKGNTNGHAILSDIQGLEDHVGDMDCKVAGTRDGITAIQMDVKAKGVSMTVLEEALKKAHKGRLHILEKMQAVLPASRAQISKYAPKVEVIKIDKDQIGEIIGPGGKIIRQIIAETGASVDVEDDGRVTISGTEPESIRKAVDWIKSITRKVKAGEEFEGIVKRIEPFGAFVEILPGKDGLVHVSKLSQEFVQDPNQIVSLGDKLKVKVDEIDELGRINLSIPGVQTAARPSWQTKKERKPYRPPQRHQRQR
ncbi:polyribonucleotide nucleotidyltransferase [Patescibacteria group bacterium]|nr:polyribonucleotide nucleotidyltransferase [Patescibacteria group bacterium]